MEGREQTLYSATAQQGQHQDHEQEQASRGDEAKCDQGDAEGDGGHNDVDVITDGGGMTLRNGNGFSTRSGGNESRRGD